MQEENGHKDAERRMVFTRFLAKAWRASHRALGSTEEASLAQQIGTLSLLPARLVGEDNDPHRVASSSVTPSALQHRSCWHLIH